MDTARCDPRRADRRFCLAVLLAAATGAAHGQTLTTEVRLRLRAGGEVTGLIVDHDDYALVIVRDHTPYVFSWREMELASALTARRAALALQRGGVEKLTAEDFLALGKMALRDDRNDVAAAQFLEAEKRDRQLATQTRALLEAYRRDRRESLADGLFEEPPDPPTVADASLPADPFWSDAVSGGPAEVEAQISQAYRRFGAKVQEVMGRDIQLLESDHFLVWTDWEHKQRDQLLTWCEAMYAALCAQFEVRPDQQVFAAKCPVFCFRSKARFRKFARYFDGYDGINATGYTRSIERHGHVHVVLVRPGKTPPDFDQFACTLVHEGSHAFVHQLYSHRLIPHWVNEGLAELMAERVLRDRCDTGETAALLARQYGRYGWPLNGLLDTVSPIDVSQYPLAHSLIAYLESRGRAEFASFVRALKEGRTTAEALAGAYGALTPAQLETAWRTAVDPTGKGPSSALESSPGD